MYEDLKVKIVKVMKYLEKKGLNHGRCGNASIFVRERGHLVITPSGLEKSKLKPEDVVVVDVEGRIIEGFHKPSSELPMHLAIYKEYRQFNAIIHAHTIYTAALSVVREPIPPILEEMVLYTGGDIRVSDYAPSGTWTLAENIVKALKNRSAAIIANHGLVACGRSIEEALEILVIVERVAHVYILSRLLGPITPLSPSSIELQRRIYAERLGIAEE